MAIDYEKLPPDVLELIYGKPKRSKYNAQRTEYNGVMYDSKAEAKHAQELDLNPNVKWVLRQVPIPLGPDFSTRVDFVVAVMETIVSFGGLRSDKDLIVRAHEVKGAETREFKRVRKLWPKYGPFALTIIKARDIELIQGKD